MKKTAKPAKKKKPEKVSIALAAPLALKVLAERSFHHFVRQAWSIVEPEMPFVDNWHIQALCNHLEAVGDGRIQNLLVNVPPGTMKSLLVCVFWPAWIWIKNAAKRFMFSSYSEDLSMRDSVRCRKIIASIWYQERWPLQFSDNQDTKGKFENIQGGWRMVGSVGGKGIGEHPDFVVADDPHNVLQAESEAERQTVTRWVEGVFLVRGVVRDVKRVMIMQRLHVQDASGTLLSKGGWVHLCLPMQYEAPAVVKTDGVEVLVPRMKPTPLGFQDPRQVDGELLWPAKYSATKVADMEANLGLYNAAGQLQQRPSPRGGGMFRRDSFEILQALPSVYSWVRYFDKAGTKGGSGARTAGVLMGKYTDKSETLPAMREKYIIADVISGRWAANQRESIIKQTAQMDRKTYGHVIVWTEQEPGSGGKESAENTMANLDGFSVKTDKVTGSKEVRAEPLSTAVSVGKVKLLAGAWNQSFLEEIEMFPLGKMRDQVDGASGAYNKLSAGSGAWTSADIRVMGGGQAAPAADRDTDLSFETDLT